MRIIIKGTERERRISVQFVIPETKILNLSVYIETFLLFLMFRNFKNILSESVSFTVFFKKIIRLYKENENYFLPCLWCWH